MIKWQFNRDKLVGREIQMIAGIISAHWGLPLAMALLAGHHDQAHLTGEAEKMRQHLSRMFPDLSIQWEWEESPKA